MSDSLVNHKYEVYGYMPESRSNESIAELVSSLSLLDHLCEAPQMVCDCEESRLVECLKNIVLSRIHGPVMQREDDHCEGCEVE